MTEADAAEAAEAADAEAMTGCVVIMYSMNAARAGAGAGAGACTVFRSKTAVVLRWLDWKDLMSWFAILSLSLG